LGLAISGLKKQSAEPNAKSWFNVKVACP